MKAIGDVNMPMNGFFLLRLNTRPVEARSRGHRWEYDL